MARTASAPGFANGLAAITVVMNRAPTLAYTYDLSGNRVAMTDPQGAATHYAYDALNRLVSLTSPDGTTTFAYDALGRRTSLTRPNGTQTTATYDAASQLTELGHTLGASTISRFAYTYDPVGNRATRTTPTGVAAYTYDGLNRLTQAQQPNPVDPLQVLTESFAYDPVGNRTASHLATGQLHDAANRLLEDSAFTYQYDLNGNMTSKTQKATGATTTYTYDVENRLVAATGPGLTAGYAYDPLGRRVAKTVNGIVTRYVYDQEDILVEYDGANMPQARYTHGPGIDEPLARTDGTSGQTVYYHADGLGSITELTDGSGAVVQRYSYDAFGAILASPGTVTQPYTFTGREVDAETELYYYRERYYDPGTGRFLQEDPGDARIETKGLPRNPFDLSGQYVYASNNPTRFVDPLGDAPQQPGGVGPEACKYYDEVGKAHGCKYHSGDGKAYCTNPRRNPCFRFASTATIERVRKALIDEDQLARFGPFPQPCVKPGRCTKRSQIVQYHKKVFAANGIPEWCFPDWWPFTNDGD